MTTEPDDGGDDDDALLARFARLRERDAGTAPNFNAVLARTRSSSRQRRALPVPVLAAIGAGAVALLVASAWQWATPPPATPDAVSLALPGWRTPTDTLLANGDDPLQPLPWAALPTAVLGHSTPHRSQETP